MDLVFVHVDSLSIEAMTSDKQTSRRISYGQGVTEDGLRITLESDFGGLPLGRMVRGPSSSIPAEFCLPRTGPRAHPRPYIICP